jgi:hypothetical protein
VNVPGWLTSWAPIIVLGCQTEMNDPTGSWMTAMRPASNTSIGPATTVAPRADAFEAVSSASATVM